MGDPTPGTIMGITATMTTLTMTSVITAMTTYPAMVALWGHRSLLPLGCSLTPVMLNKTQPVGVPLAAREIPSPSRAAPAAPIPTMTPTLDCMTPTRVLKLPPTTTLAPSLLRSLTTLMRRSALCFVWKLVATVMTPVPLLLMASTVQFQIPLSVARWAARSP